VALDGDFVAYVALHGQTKGDNVSATDLVTPISEWLALAKQAGIETIFVTTGGPPSTEKQRHCGVRSTETKTRQTTKADPRSPGTPSSAPSQARFMI
jgi:hypothetical protein